MFVARLGSAARSKRGQRREINNSTLAAAPKAKKMANSLIPAGLHVRASISRRDAGTGGPRQFSKRVVN
ncbi:MAG: hypothetical protein DMF04_06755 [Verrucomicrobia bacterium]|nr:MAG: hypothetical protein DMF04_06755 [Verrucomicrobiota bacterium]